MRVIRWAAILAIPVMLFALAGCGSNSSGSFNPTSLGTSGNNVGGTGTGGTLPTAGSASMTLTANPAIVDANNGQVLATAILTDASGATISGRPVTFAIVAGPATVDQPLVSVPTDTSGKALKTITPVGNTLTTTNVIVQATTTVATQTVTAYATFQIVRGSGVITLPAIKEVSDTVDPNITSVIFHEQILATVTDANGNPRVGVPVTLAVYSQTGTSVVTIDYHAPTVTEPSASTVTTDSKGEAIFNVTIAMSTPGPGLKGVDSIVFKAANNDAFPLTAYTGIIATVTQKLPPLTLIPATTSFATGDGANATRTFTVSGGLGPYTVNSSDPSRVSVPSSTTGTFAATLVDASLWTEVVTITVTDQSGQTASATIKRQ